MPASHHAPASADAAGAGRRACRQYGQKAGGGGAELIGWWQPDSEPQTCGASRRFTAAESADVKAACDCNASSGPTPATAR